jgi:hypothetical protein
MQWTVHSTDGQVALEIVDRSRVIKIPNLKLSMDGAVGECWSINRCRKLVAMS